MKIFESPHFLCMDKRGFSPNFYWYCEFKYLVSNGLFWWEVKSPHLLVLALQFLMQASELCIPSIDIPLIILYPDINLQNTDREGNCVKTSRAGVCPSLPKPPASAPSWETPQAPGPHSPTPTSAFAAVHVIHLILSFFLLFLFF